RRYYIVSCSECYRLGTIAVHLMVQVFLPFLAIEGGGKATLTSSTPNLNFIQFGQKLPSFGLGKFSNVIGPGFLSQIYALLKKGTLFFECPFSHLTSRNKESDLKKWSIRTKMDYSNFPNCYFLADEGF